MGHTTTDGLLASLKGPVKDTHNNNNPSDWRMVSPRFPLIRLHITPKYAGPGVLTEKESTEPTSPTMDGWIFATARIKRHRAFTLALALGWHQWRYHTQKLFPNEPYKITYLPAGLLPLDSREENAGKGGRESLSHRKF